MKYAVIISAYSAEQLLHVKNVCNAVNDHKPHDQRAPWKL